MLPEFRNEPFTDFSQPQNRDAMKAAIAKVKSDFGKEYPLVIGGEKVFSGDWIVSTNPAAPDQVVGKFAKSNVELDLVFSEVLGGG